MLHHAIKQIRTRNKLGKEVTLQGCRRTFISTSMDAGLSAELVASVAGNSVAVIEKHYKDLRTMKADHVAALHDYSKLCHAKNHAKTDS